MPTKRTPIARASLPRIIPEVIAMFERVEALKRAGADDVWLDAAVGSPRREYLDLSAELHHRLGLFPHQAGVNDIDRGPTKAESPAEFARTREMRRLLLKAARAQKRAAAGA